MVDVVIWSKDRACQLDLLLRSMWKCMPWVGNVRILYLATTPEFERGYRRVQCDYRWEQLSWCQQRNFREDLLGILSRSAEYVLGISDDNVFISSVPVLHTCDLVCMLASAAGISLRLNPGIRYCQPAGLQIDPPAILECSTPRNIRFLSCAWVHGNPRGCWGYPHPCDSHIYYRDLWLSLLYNGDFYNPCTMENWMDTNRPSESLLSFFPDSTLVSICNNRVQDTSTNPFGEQTADFLNTEFLKGKQIRLEPFLALRDITQCHMVMPYELEDGVI